MNFLMYTFTVMLGAFLAFPASSAPERALPSTLKPEPHQRDPYDWNARHEAVRKRNQSVKPEYVMIGDSITHHWGGEPSGDSRKAGEASWEQLFGSHAVTNMGFGFDYVDNAYYRVQNGELDGISPRVIIVLLGTNNLGHRKDTPQACADNIKAFLRLVRQKCPSSKILLLGVLPRKEKNLAGPVKETNKLLAKLQNGKNIFFADPGKALLSADGVSPKNEFMKDVVHPNSRGYEVLEKELAALLKKMDARFRGGKPAGKQA